MKNSINRNLSDDQNQLFQKWQAFPSNNTLEGLSSFVALHPNLMDEGQKPLLYAILSDLYGTNYLSGARMSVNRYIKDLMGWKDYDSLGLDRDELTRHCLEVYFHVSTHEPDIEDLCLAYPTAKDFIYDFAEKNRDWLFPSHSSSESGKLSLGNQESISEAYKVLKMIGHGGQKEVYTVTQQSTGQILALKVPSREDGGKEEFISEANIQAGLSHQGIPAVFSLAFGPDTPTRLVERYIDGTSWANIFPDQTQEENIQILERTSRILASSHLEHHVIHGDIKPLNVMINPKYNEIYLVDWGMAIHLDQKPERLIPRGTIDYLPPEVANGEIDKVCMGTDVFMLGAVLYHILTGYAPYSKVFTDVGPFDAMIYASEGRWPALPETGLNGTIPQELREIVEKAMAFNPEDRYHDAGQFADALTKYLKRARLLDRYEKAKAYNEELRKRYQTSGMKHRDRALLLADAIGNVNEFALIRRDIAETEKDTLEKSTFFRDVFNSELTSRQFLLEKTISVKDYAQATAQLETERESVVSYSKLFGADPSYDAFIQKAERDIKHGLAVQNRDRLMKWATLGMVVLVLALVTLFQMQRARYARQQEVQAQRIASQAQENEALAKKNEKHAQENEALARKNEKQSQEIARQEKEAKEKSNQELNKQIQKLLDLAEYQRLGQGKLAIESSLIEIPSFCPISWRQECTLHTSLLPVQCASGIEIMETVAFSPDERYFIGKTSDNYLTCWQTENGQFVSRVKIVAEIPGMDGAVIMPNPCFQSSEATSPSASSEFLILTTKGMIVFWNHAGEIQESADVNLVKENPELFSDYESLTFGRPVFLTQGDSPVMVVGNEHGKILFFSLPDGKLLKQVQGPEKGINWLSVSPDQKHLVLSGNDGLYRYWETDGEMTEDFELPLSMDKNRPYVFCRRLDISPNGQLLAAGNETGEILVWDILNKKVIAKMQEDESPDNLPLIIQRVSWLDDSRLLTICPNGHYRIWDLSKRNAEGIPESMDLPVKDSLPMFGIRAGALSPSRQKLLLRENNFNLSLFDMQTGKKELAAEGLPRFRFQNISLPIPPVWHKGLGRIIVGGCDYNPIRLYDPETMQTEVLAPLLDQRQIWVATSIEAASEGTRFAIALTPLDRRDKGVIQLYEGNPPVLKSEIKSESDLKYPGESMMCALSPDGKLFAEMDHQNEVLKIHDWETGKVLKTIEVASVPSTFAFNNKNQLIMIMQNQKILLLVNEMSLTRWDCDWNSESEKPEKADEFALVAMVTAMSFSRDGRLLVLGLEDGKMLLLDSQDFSKKKELDFSEPLYSQQNNVAEIMKMRKSGIFLTSKNCVTGISWSPNNELMMVSFSSGKSVLVETDTFSEVASCYCGEETNQPGDFRIIHPVFAGEDQLFTFSGNCAIHRWNWVPSPEKPVVLWKKNGVLRIREFRDGMLACFEKYDREENPFFVLQGKDEVFRIKNIIDFQCWQNGTFLLLKKDGAFMAVNEKGEPVELPGLLKSLPSGEIKKFQVSTDGRWIGIHLEDKTIWYADLLAKESNWIQVKVGEKNTVNVFSFAAAHPEMILLTSQPQLRVWDLEKQELVRKTNSIISSSFSPMETYLLEMMKYECFQATVSQSGKYVFSVSPGNAIEVWDQERQEIVQIISPNVLSSSFDCLYLLPLDRGFGEWENEDAFVVGGYDGTLHFYQYVPAEKKFRNVYVVSQLQLADCMELPDFVEDKLDKMFKNNVREMFQLVKRQNCWITTLDLSEDGKTLYVGSIENVYSYNMDEIRENVAGLKEKWENISTEDLTSLRFSLDKGIESVNRVFLKKSH